MENKELDLLVVLGQNWQWPLFHIITRRHPYGLSAASKLEATVAARLYKEGKAKEILFSTGHTAGNTMPSEAQAMKAYVMQHFPDIPESAMLTEDVSIDTAGNAQEVKKILEQREDKTIGLLTTKRHTSRSVRLFARAGIEFTETLAADKLPMTDPVYKAQVRAYRRSIINFGQRFTEPIARLTVITEQALQLKPGSTLRTISRHTRR